MFFGHYLIRIAHFRASKSDESLKKRTFARNFYSKQCPTAIFIMLKIQNLNLLSRKEQLAAIPEGKLVINTINAFSYVCVCRDGIFEKAITEADYLLPDGMSMIWACRLLKNPNPPQERIAGWDLFSYEMDRFEAKGKEAAAKGEKLPRVMFFGSAEWHLDQIREKAAQLYPHIEVVTYSPPFKEEFEEEDSRRMIDAINTAKPDLLWIGMTAPKQEKWVYCHLDKLDINCHIGSIGAVFNFFTDDTTRAPRWMQEAGFEWLYRFCRNPRRLAYRYIVGNSVFLWHVCREYFGSR